MLTSLQAWTLARAYLLPRDIGPSLHSARTPENTQQMEAIAFLMENGRRDALVQEVMKGVMARFGLVRRDIARYMSRLHVSRVILLEDVI